MRASSISVRFQVFQGLLMVKAEHADTQEKLLKLWCHEESRVFRDRLISAEDRAWFNDALQASHCAYASTRPTRSPGPYPYNTNFKRCFLLPLTFVPDSCQLSKNATEADYSARTRSHKHSVQVAGRGSTVIAHTRPLPRVQQNRINDDSRVAAGKCSGLFCVENVANGRKGPLNISVRQ